MVAQHLLLDFLADRHQHKDTALSLSARTFLTCRLFADELTSLRAAAALTQQQQAQLLVKYQNTSEQLEKGLVCDLNAGGLASTTLHSRFAGQGSSLLLVSQLAVQPSYAQCQQCSQLRPPCKHWPLLEADPHSSSDHLVHHNYQLLPEYLQLLASDHTSLVSKTNIKQRELSITVAW